MTARFVLLATIGATAWVFASSVGAEPPRPPSVPARGARQAAATALGSTGGSVWDGVYTEGQVARGEVVYFQECANCHGDGLGGADVTPALVGGVFTSNWNDLTVGDLFERIRTTMPADRPRKLTRQQNSDVIAFVLKANGWPAGKSDLSSELALLKQIKIEATKPAGQH